MKRHEIAAHIASRLAAERDALEAQYAASAAAIGHFFVDGVLPEATARAIRASFPEPARMTHNRSLREDKYIAAQMNRYDPLLEEALYAFQDPRVLEEVGRITGLAGLEPDPFLYAGGISVMARDQFLNPHIDNSHDRDRRRWRAFNALYYVSPEWADESGGHLELWPRGVAGTPLVLHSRFNRLVMMATHAGSWHSVCPIRADGLRCCVSNYYFREQPPREGETFHITAFRGRPEQPLRDLVLRADAAARGALRKIFPGGVRKVTHQYRRAE
jgi:Rps23 Pro-64 3,4-dihydroxylase Tpa1-like proline 4-hydroxylase